MEPCPGELVQHPASEHETSIARGKDRSLLRTAIASHLNRVVSSRLHLRRGVCGSPSRRAVPPVGRRCPSTRADSWWMIGSQTVVTSPMGGATAIGTSPMCWPTGNMANEVIAVCLSRP